jgi:2-oxoglutarate dehydrogenase E2 component (dihydrolipoamide succinyltransferase)
MKSMDIKVPVLPESVADALVAHWHKKVGDPIKRDDPLVDIETDKVVLEVVAESDGVLSTILKADGTTVLAQECIGRMDVGAVAVKEEVPKDLPQKEAIKEEVVLKTGPVASGTVSAGPAARRMAQEHSLNWQAVKGSGKGGRVTTTDLLSPEAASAQIALPVPSQLPLSGKRIERRVPMTRLRAKIAERLVQAQQTAAILTTMNEINMGPVMELRKKHKEQFEKVHGVRLGFMSFFVKAVTEALKAFPNVNASLDGSDIVYHDYCDIGVAVSSPRGLVVPVLRDVQQWSMADIEGGIAAFGQKAKDGRLTLDELTGGTFTISNGGVFGSLLSTPILNPPQTGILGMHKIQERPIVENGAIVIRPMMYVALSYDHRLIDGSESVRFLVAIKECVEDPTRLLLGI